ncbi:hypothetical protein Tco_1218332 [Tanacetum coccineum]
MHGPYVRRMIPELGDPNREVHVAETFNEWTDDELTDKKVKQMEADDQAIQTILMGLPKDIYAVVDSLQNVKNQNANQNVDQNGNGNVVAARAEEFDLMADAWDLDEIEEVNLNYILMAILQQASTSGIQIDKAPVYDLDGLAEVHEYDKCYNNEIFNMFTQEEHMEQSRGIVEQNPATVEETRALYDSLYNNLAIEVEKVNTVNRKMK